MKDLQIRTARRDDLPAIIALLADDILGGREKIRTKRFFSVAYQTAFDAIEADARNELIVVDDTGVVGVFQVTSIPGLTYPGGERAQIEGVRVAASHRSRASAARCSSGPSSVPETRGCRMVQLTTDKRRADAHRFYESLGFVASHEGMKLRL